VGLRQGLTTIEALNMENLLVGAISAALILYLIFTIIRPEKF
jgi:K+-transporting ATPase KdpF subunit